jgi:hypothetical protein
LALPGGTNEEYTYAADGKRRKKRQVQANQDRLYLWEGENLLWEEHVGGATKFTDFPGVWGGLVSHSRSGAFNFYAFDLQGNSRLLVDDDGVTIRNRYVYKAFGEKLVESGSEPNALQYGGQWGYYQDLGSRLYVRARHLRVDVERTLS